MSRPPDDNPYAALPDEEHRAPAVRVASELEPPRFRPLAVVVGLAVDIGGSQVVAGLYVLAVAVHLGIGPDLSARLMLTLSGVPQLTVLFVLGSGMSALGGFVTAVIAKQREYRHVLVQAAFTLAFGALLRVAGPSGGGIEMPGWLRNLSYVMVVPMLLLGARLAIARRERRERLG